MAVVRLMTMSNLAGCSTGMSASFEPRKSCRHTRRRAGTDPGTLVHRTSGRQLRRRRSLAVDHHWAAVQLANSKAPHSSRSRDAAALLAYADLRTALSTSVLPSDQIAPGTLWLEAMTESNAVAIQLQSSSVMVSGGNSLTVWLPCPETCVRIL
jgi:hypothetical protein